MSAANTQFDPAAIATIVREVLRRLESTGALSGTVNSSLGKTFAEPHIYECDDKLVTLETLRDKLEQIKTLRVKPGTIVTPAVRDELRDRKISISFDLPVEQQAAGGGTILLGTTCEKTGTHLRDQLNAGGSRVNLQTDSRVSRLATKISENVSTITRGLIVTDQPYTAACVANRNANARAVVVRDQSELAAAKTELNPNCIVLHSSEIERLNLPAIIASLN